MDPQFLFQIQSPSLVGGVDADASSAVNEAYINGVYAGLNFCSLITHGSFDPAADAVHNLRISMPIAENLFTTNDAVLPPKATTFNFFSESATFSSHHSEKLPNLLSLETAARSESSFPINRRFENVSAKPRKSRRQQQQWVSEKTRRLQKLLPCDEKMDTAKALEEAYKYIKFLEAQVSVLQSMPKEDCESGGNRSTTTETESGGDLGRLNRQQLLQVVVNSPVAQQLLYSNGCCVYSVEQMVLLKKKAERNNALFHQMMYGSHPSSLFSAW